MTKLFVVTHRAVELPASETLQLRYVDDAAGENIAQKADYSELRVHYQVWRNPPTQTDAVGFFQFRRYLNLDPALLTRSGEKRPCPYTTKKLPRAADYTCQRAEAVLRGLDVLAPTWEYTGESVRAHYDRAHRAGDLDLMLQILHEQHPAFDEAAQRYLSGLGEYYGNLYIMAWAAFDAYCSWLFPLLQAYDLRAADIPPRTQGYLAERLFGIWFTHVSQTGGWRCGELPRVHFWGYDDATHHLRRDGFINRLLPPGSQRRAAVRKQVRL